MKNSQRLIQRGTSYVFSAKKSPPATLTRPLTGLERVLLFRTQDRFVPYSSTPPFGTRNCGARQTINLVMDGRGGKIRYGRGGGGEDDFCVSAERRRPKRLDVGKRGVAQIRGEMRERFLSRPVLFSSETTPRGDDRICCPPSKAVNPTASTPLTSSNRACLK
jgi:hypothetical protein